MDREGFINNSSLAMKGTINGILGSLVYELIISFVVVFILTYVVSSNNPSTSGEELNVLINEAYNSFPYGIMISCLSSVVTLSVFAFILGFNRLKEILKKAFNNKTIKYGLITAICMMSFSIVYNIALTSILNLDEAGNANQGNVIQLLGSQPVLGFLAIVILAPLVEELTYRYCLFGGLHKKKWLAYAVSGFVFMFMHSIASFSEISVFSKEFLIELAFLPPYLFSGLALCYAYDKTDNLGASFIAHMINNLVSFLSIVLL